jgi:hypothetical protein
VPVEDLVNLANRNDVGLYSFRTINLSQTAPNHLPMHLFRGDVIVPESAVTHEGIAKLADGIVAHLLKSMWPEPPTALLPDGEPIANPIEREPLGLMGGYSIVADQYKPLVAPPLEQALAAMALNRYAREGALNSGLDEAMVTAAGQAGARILRDLDAVSLGEESPRHDPAACAAIIYAVAERPELRDDPVIDGLFQAALQNVRACFEPGAGFVNRLGPGGQARAISPHAQALLAGALARTLHMPRLEPRAQVDWTRHAVDAAWQSAPQPQHIALLPWIGWAERDLAAASGIDDGGA